MADKIQKSFKFSLRVKGTEHKFHPELGPGELCNAVYTYDADKESEFRGPMFAASISEHMREFMEQYVEVIVDEVD